MSFLDSLLDGIGDAADEVGAAWSRGFFDVTQSVFDLLGFRTAADNLRRYRSGVGGDYTYSAEEMARHPAYDESIDRNRSRFESTTFTGRTKNDEIIAAFLSLVTEILSSFLTTMTVISPTRSLQHILHSAGQESTQLAASMLNGQVTDC